MNDIITANGILSHLKTKNINLTVCESVDSTNFLLKQMALEGKGEGEVIIALSQTAGHGRYNRKFHSDKGGIYMSILLRPTATPDNAILTAATAVAASDAIENISGKTTQIKWVNDILINNKKVCGILCEGGFVGDSGFIIAGIGINAYPPENGRAVPGEGHERGRPNEPDMRHRVPVARGQPRQDRVGKPLLRPVHGR